MPFNTLVTIIYFYDFNDTINKINTQTRKQLLNKILTHHKSPLNISETYFFVICRFVVILLGINREIMASGRLESNRPDTPAEKR